MKVGGRCSSPGVHRGGHGPAPWRGHHRPAQLRGAQLTGAGKDGNALIADTIKVGGDVLLDDGFSRGRSGPAGRGHHRPAECRGAQLNGTDGDGNALVADGMKVGGDVFLDQGFTAAGTVWLHSVALGWVASLGPRARRGASKSRSTRPGAQIAGKLEWAPAGRSPGRSTLRAQPSAAGRRLER